jgi:hypothetical protein
LLFESIFRFDLLEDVPEWPLSFDNLSNNIDGYGLTGDTANGAARKLPAKAAKSCCLEFNLTRK